ncbi:hypothetical protein [Pediococcus pentosaceus]|uniref:hypothetical protein n=1 Tax=Pediococcus pentosaceus TaxID=1255 RepID=UPI0020C0A42F|nr:hypothetical protein [Pediococcus pentosaceus]
MDDILIQVNRECSEIEEKFKIINRPLSINDLKYLKKIIVHLLFIKYMFFSEEDNIFYKLLILDLVSSLSSLLKEDERLFYMYSRSSIEMFYNISIHDKYFNKLNMEADGYYKAKKSFNNKISHLKKFKFTTEFKKLNEIYGDLSNQIHGSANIPTELGPYISSYIAKDDFKNKEKITNALIILEKLTLMYSYFFVNSPSMKATRENSFYKKKDMWHYFKSQINENHEI